MSLTCVGAWGQGQEQVWLSQGLLVPLSPFPVIKKDLAGMEREQEEGNCVGEGLEWMNSNGILSCATGGEELE